jgi:hypothetical protein
MFVQVHRKSKRIHDIEQLQRIPRSGDPLAENWYALLYAIIGKKTGEVAIKAIIGAEPTDVREKKKCPIEGCNREAFWRTYCQKHYLRIKKFGNAFAEIADRRFKATKEGDRNG